ncbi:unnamed protein product [Lepidochelys kempii]
MSPQDEMQRQFLNTLNDCFLEQLVQEPTRGEATLDLVLSGAQDLVQEVTVTGLLGNSDHNIITFNIPVVGRTPQQPNTVAFNFRKGNSAKMRRLFKQKLKGTVIRVKFLQAAWTLFKDTITEAQLKCIPQIKKHSKRTKKEPPWLNNHVKEAVRDKKASFKKWKSNPSEVNRKEHKHCQIKCKNVIRKAKKEFEEQLAKNSKGNKGKSCLTNLLEFFEGVNKHVYKGDPVDIVTLDFQKAFDKVPHQRLLRKLNCHGIRGKILSWIENWLKDREQRVGINGKFSEWRGVTSGVPQGSVLGPILFNLFIKDLEKGVNSEVAKFADDTKLLKIVKTKADCEELQKDLTKLSDWATKWQMKFNVDKCKVMHIGKNNPNQTYNTMGSNLATTNQERDLGVIVDSSLNTSMQCAVVKKANRMLGIIKKGIENKMENILLPLYKSMVCPHLEYCIQMWSPHLKKDIVALEKVQRRATKMISGLERVPYEERLKRLGLFSLEKRRLRGDMMEI